MFFRHIHKSLRVVDIWGEQDIFLTTLGPKLKLFLPAGGSVAALQQKNKVQFWTFILIGELRNNLLHSSSVKRSTKSRWFCFSHTAWVSMSQHFHGVMLWNGMQMEGNTVGSGSKWKHLLQSACLCFRWRDPAQVLKWLCFTRFALLRSCYRRVSAVTRRLLWSSH